MITIKKQYHGIKFPFTSNNNKSLFIDLNETEEDRVISNILHVIMTPKGTRIRYPDFGTNLAKFLFEPSDGLTWDGVQKEVITSVNKYVIGGEITSIDIIRDENDDNKAYLDINYQVLKGKTIVKNNKIVEI